MHYRTRSSAAAGVILLLGLFSSSSAGTDGVSVPGITCTLPIATEGDLDCSGAVDAVDLAVLIDAVFFGLDLGGDTCDTNPSVLANGDFESGFELWSPYQYGSGWTTPTTDAHCGVSVAAFEFPGGTGYYDAAIRSALTHVEAGVPYWFSFWIREVDTRDTFDPNETIFDPVVVVNGVGFNTPHPAQSDQWQYVYSVIVFPETGDAEVEFQIHGFALSGNAHCEVDDVLLIRMAP